MKNEKTYLYKMNSVIINGLAIALSFVFLILTKLIVKDYSIGDFLSLNVLGWSLMLTIPYCIVHEILHSVAYVIYGANFKNITYGMHLEKGILCCSCKQSISKKNILWSLVYPLIFIGIITYVIGIVFNLKILTLLSIFNIAGCGGDLIMFFALFKIKDFKFFEYDNPLAFGIITSENLDGKKFVGLELMQDETVTQTIDKKVNISKESIAILIVYMVFVVASMVLSHIMPILED